MIIHRIPAQQLITQMSLSSSKCHFLTTMTSLAVSVSVVSSGTVKVRPSYLSKLDGTNKTSRLLKLFGFFGLERRETYS